MEKQFCDYEIAFALKELGFDEECFGYFGIKDEILRSIDTDFKSFRGLSFECLAAPLWQQAIDWIREICNLHIEIERYVDEDNTYSFIGWVCGDLEEEIPTNDDYTESYFEARTAAILEAIEIIKNKNEERTSY